jgi:hypothetical protein
MSLDLPTIELLFAPSVVGGGAGDRLILDVGPPLDTGTLGDGSFFADISAYVRAFSTTRGKSRELDRYTTGTAQFVLDNRTRIFDPTNTASIFYNSTIGVTGITPSVPVIFRVTYDGVLYPVFRGSIDSWRFDYGPGGVGDATATITCSDAFKVLSQVLGGLPAFASITSSGTGVVDVGVSTPSDGTSGPSSIDVVETPTIVSTGNVNVVSGTETTPVIGTSGDLSGVRVNTILDAVSWPQNLRNIATGISVLEVQSASQSVLSMLQEVADTEAGDVYSGADGVVIFADRNDLISQPASLNVQATYDTTDPFGMFFAEANIVYDDDLIYNIIRVNRKTTSVVNGDTLVGTTVTVSNVESQSLYGARSLNLELPIPSTVGSDTSYGQDTAENLGLFLASIYANPELRPDQITFKPRLNPSVLFPEVLVRALRDKVVVKFAVPGGGLPIERSCFVQQVSHIGTPDSWITRFGLTSATFYTGFFILDDSTFGVLDTNKLGF